MAQLKIDICKDCKFKKWYFCGECWCELHAKAESGEDCPKGYWPKNQKGQPK